MVDDNLKSRIRGAARSRDFAKVDELWTELAAQGAWQTDLALFFDVANDLSDRGERERAGSLLLSLLDDMRKAGRQDEAFELARRAAKYSPKAKGLRDELLGHYRRVYAERPGLDAALKRSGLVADGPCDKAVVVLDDALRFAVGDFCSHASGWGIGKVVEAHPETGEYVIDFSRRRGHRMDAQMARTSTQKRDPDDLDVLLWTDKEKVKLLAEDDPLSLLKSALKSAPGGKLQARDLREKLGGEILDKNLWTRFWARARKLAKDDPWIEVGAAPKSLITVRTQPLSRDAEVTKNVDKAGPFVKKLEAARRELLAVAKDAVAKGLIPGWLKTGVAAMQKDIDTPPKGRPLPNAAAILRAMKLELSLFRLEAANLMPHAASELGVQAPDAAAASGEAVDPETGEPLGPKARPTTVPADVAKALEGLQAAELPQVLREMNVQEYRRRIVGLVRPGFPSDWQERVKAVLLDPAPGTFESCVRELKEEAAQLLEDACSKIIISPTKFPDAFSALSRARFNGRLEGIASKRNDAEIVAKAIQLLDDVTHRLKSAAEKGEKGSLKTAVDSLRALFAEKSQRVIGTVIKNGTEAEVRRILQLVIRLEIGRALEFGDISENSELDAARERQKQLAVRVERMRTELEQVTIIKPEEVETDEVRVGTRVVLKDMATSRDETYTVLGPWDADEAHNVISFLSPIARALMGRRAGEEVEAVLPDGTKRKVEILSIDRAVATTQQLQGS
ncbi:GreA/GreB family elongation factor [bacterium]|nr:GreA/GreB family elongation factor [bacterium]